MAVLQKHYFYQLQINNPSSGTRIIQMNMPIIQTGIYDFSEVFDYFVKKIHKFGIQLNSDTFFIFDYYSTWNNKSTKSIYDLNTLKSTIKGFLKLDIQKSKRNRNLVKVLYEGEEFNVIGGIYIHPYSYSILKENEIIKGFMIDTTFKAMPHYLTSIIMGCTKNIGISLGFSFGLSENKELYKRHFETFQEQLQIDLSQFVFLSDQGTAICAICDEYKVTNLCCLRHLLASLKYNKYSYVAGEFLKCTSEIDYGFLKEAMLPIFNEINDDEEINKLNKTLEKIGLVYKDKDIKELQTSKWMRSSMLYRPMFSMPSTTNSLESLHGHINKRTPRNNNFYASIARLACSITFSIKNINHKIKHNFDYLKRTTYRFYEITNKDLLIRQENFYNSTFETCKCNKNAVVSSTLELDLPCCHRIDKGATFPECPQLKLILNEKYTELVVKYNPVEPDEININYDETYNNKNYAIIRIKRFSGFKDKDEITQYVDHSYCSENDCFFISGKPKSLIEMVQEGINYFTDLKIQRKNEKQKIREKKQKKKT